MTTIVLASNNPKKAREMRQLLPEGFDVVTADVAGIQLPEETGQTFEENALLKARAAASQSGLLSVADDSGLEIDALDGKPGVRSARFAADHGRPATEAENNRLTLEVMSRFDDSQRSARFVSAVAVVDQTGREAVVRGTVEGQIEHHAAGSHGFGYDPLFRPEGSSRTMAQLTDDEKNSISHRAKAFEQALPVILDMAQRSAPEPK